MRSASIVIVQSKSLKTAEPRDVTVPSVGHGSHWIHFGWGLGLGMFEKGEHAFKYIAKVFWEGNTITLAQGPSLSGLVRVVWEYHPSLCRQRCHKAHPAPAISSYPWCWVNAGLMLAACHPEVAMLASRWWVHRSPVSCPFPVGWEDIPWQERVGTGWERWPYMEGSRLLACQCPHCGERGRAPPFPRSLPWLPGCSRMQW